MSDQVRKYHVAAVPFKWYPGYLQLGQAEAGSLGGGGRQWQEAGVGC